MDVENADFTPHTYLEDAGRRTKFTLQMITRYFSASEDKRRVSKFFLDELIEELGRLYSLVNKYYEISHYKIDVPLYHSWKCIEMASHDYRMTTWYGHDSYNSIYWEINLKQGAAKFYLFRQSFLEFIKKLQKPLLKSDDDP